VAADVAARLVSIATQYKQANDSAGQSFDAVMAQFPPKLLKEAHKAGVATSDLGNGAKLTTKEAVGLDGSAIKYGFVTDADGKRYTVSDGLVKEVTGAAGSEWDEAFQAAVRSKIAVVDEAPETSRLAAVRAKPELPKGVTRIGSDRQAAVIYNFSVNEVGVRLDIFTFKNSGTVGFTVNGSSYSNGNSLSPRDSAKVAIKLASIIKYDASTRADGYEYTTSAVTSDGQGAKRALAYQRLGFSRPVDGEAGLRQYGEVINGKLTPNDTKVAEKDDVSQEIVETRMTQMKQDRKSSK
jgi:hypothetical protein